MASQNRKNEHSNRGRKPPGLSMRAARWAMAGVGVLAVLLLAGFFLLKLPAVEQKVRRAAVDVLEKKLAVQMEIGRVSGSLLQNLTLHEVKLFRNGRPFLEAEHIAARYHLLPLFAGSLHLGRLHIEALRLHLVQEPSGQWNPPAVTQSKPPKAAETRTSLRIDQISLSGGRIIIEPDNRRSYAIHDIELEAALKTGSTSRLDLRHAEFTLQPLAFGVRSFRGMVRYEPQDRRLELRRISLETSGSHLALNGEIQTHPGQPRIDAELHVARLSLNELDPFLPGPPLQNASVAGSIRLYGPVAQLHHQVRLEMASQRLTAEGQTTVSDDHHWQLETAGSLANINPGSLPLTDPPAVQGRLNGDFTVRGHDLTATDRRLHLELILQPSEIDTLVLKSGRLSMELHNDAVSVADSRIESAAGILQFSGKVAELSARPVLNAAIGVRNLRPGQMPWLDKVTISGSLNGDAVVAAQQIQAGAAGMASWSGRGWLQVHASTLETTTIRESRLEAEWDGRRLYIPKLIIDSEIGRARLHGAVSPQSRAVEATGWIEIPELARLQARMRPLLPSPYREFAPAGSLRIEGAGTAAAGRAEIAAKLDGTHLALKQISAESASLTTRWQGGWDDFQASVNGRIGKIAAGNQRLAALQLSASAAGPRLQWDLQGRAENGSPLKFTGQAENWLGPERRIRVDTLAVQNPPQPLGNWIAYVENRGPLMFTVSKHALQIGKMALTVDGAELALRGNLHRTGEQQLELSLRQYSLAHLSSIAGLPNLPEGRIGLEAQIAGSFENPKITAELSADIDPEAGGWPAAVHAQLSCHGGRVDLTGQGLRDGSRLFTIAGEFGMRLQLLPFRFQLRPGSLNLALNARGLPLDRLSVPLPAAVQLEGLLDLQLRASGDPLAPDFHGTADLREGSLRLSDAALAYEEFSARLFLEPKRIRIDSARLQGDGKGSLSASGTIALTDWRPSEFDLHFRGSHLRIPYRDAASAQVNADLKLTGNWDGPVLTGRLAVIEGRIDLDRLTTGMPAEIEIVDNRRSTENGLVYDTSLKRAGFFDSLSADLVVDIVKDTWVKGQGLNAELTGSLDLKKRASEPFRLVGSLSTVRGNYKFQGKLFRIRSGTVVFTGQPDPNPELDIEATTQIRRVDIVVEISGPADRLQLDLASDPPLQQSDIVSYLVFGRPTSELRWQQSASADNAALSMTGNLAASELEGILEEVLNLDMLTFDFSEEEFTQSTVALGKYVTRNIFVTYRHGIATRDYGQVEVDYQITRNFTLQTQLGDELTSGVDLIWELDF